jgi:hypothetical protein
MEAWVSDYLARITKLENNCLLCLVHRESRHSDSDDGNG